jgi:excisionase family DNA binding protein
VDREEDGAGLLDKAAAAAYLCTNVRHLERLWAKRKIAAVKVGRKVHFKRSDLDAFIERNRVEAIGARSR